MQLYYLWIVVEGPSDVSLLLYLEPEDIPSVILG